MSAEILKKDRVFIIAEAGVNHNGNVDRAKRLIDAAAEAGADAVKFQTFRPETLAVKGVAKAEYQKETTGPSGTQYEMLKKLALDVPAHLQLMDHCNDQEIFFLSSPFSIGDVDFLYDIGVRIYKIPSGEITNYPYLRRIGGLAEEVILSTGMANMAEIGDALQVLIDAGTPKEKIIVLHCNTAYPTPFENVNLRAMSTIEKTFHLRTGYSDHTIGIEVPTAAAALGATVIEKHFTLDKEDEGPDHRASLSPVELRSMVQAIRNIEKAMGSPVKRPSPSESVNLNLIRKKIVARHSIQKGELFTEENLTTKRTQDPGVSPMRWRSIIGTPAWKEFLPDEAIR